MLLIKFKCYLIFVVHRNVTRVAYILRHLHPHDSVRVCSFRMFAIACKQMHLRSIPLKMSNTLLLHLNTFLHQDLCNMQKKKRKNCVIPLPPSFAFNRFKSDANYYLLFSTRNLHVAGVSLNSNLYGHVNFLLASCCCCCCRRFIFVYVFITISYCMDAHFICKKCLW